MTGHMGHRPLTRTLNECATRERRMRTESEKMIEHTNGCENKIGIENEAMTECTNGSESENRIVNRSVNKNSIAKSHFLVTGAVCGPIFGRLTAHILGLGYVLGDRSHEILPKEGLPRRLRSGAHRS